jgi:hypothetical protein
LDRDLVAKGSDDDPEFLFIDVLTIFLLPESLADFIEPEGPELRGFAEICGFVLVFTLAKIDSM